MFLKEGVLAPDFALDSDEGREITLKEFRGRKVVLYFYPKDDTPGCTKEACAFRDAYDLFLEKGAVVIGVSADNGKSHEKFRKRYNLPFYLLSDPKKTVMKAYGAWGKKTVFGKTGMGIIRSTYIMDEKGRIIKVFPKVAPEGHAEEVLKLL